MTFSQSYHGRSADNHDFIRRLGIEEGAEVALHTTAGHVVTGVVTGHAWHPTTGEPYAVWVSETSPAPTYRDPTATITYDRIVLMAHVFEIRPRMHSQA